MKSQVVAIGFQVLLCMLLTACVVNSDYQAKNTRCLFPCEFREKIPIIEERVNIWLPFTQSIGTYTNVSRQIGDQTSTSECIVRQGPFFILREFGQYSCFKLVAITNTDWFFHVSPASDTLLPFCELCDGLKFTGPFYISAGNQQSVLDRSRPIGCNLPSVCPRRSNQHNCCPNSEPFDTGRNCKVLRSPIRLYNRQQRDGRPGDYRYGKNRA